MFRQRIASRTSRGAGQLVCLRIGTGSSCEATWSAAAALEVTHPALCTLICQAGTRAQSKQRRGNGGGQREPACTKGVQHTHERPRLGRSQRQASAWPQGRPAAARRGRGTRARRSTLVQTSNVERGRPPSKQGLKCASSSPVDAQPTNQHWPSPYLQHIRMFVGREEVQARQPSRLLRGRQAGRSLPLPAPLPCFCRRCWSCWTSWRCCHASMRAAAGL